MLTGELSFRKFINQLNDRWICLSIDFVNQSCFGVSFAQRLIFRANNALKAQIKLVQC
jgi:hypothetical protein